MKNQKMQIKWNSKISGIYAWENIVNGKMYIGKATDLYKRVYAEMNGFNHDKHQNLKKLYNAIKKYGINKFQVIKLLECPRDYLEKVERYLIEYYNTKNNGYNCTFGGEGSPGHKKTKEQIDKHKIKLQKYWTVEKRTEQSNKMKKWFKGQPVLVQKNIKSGNEWWLNPVHKRNHLKHCISSLTQEKIEKQKASLKEFYKTHTNKRAVVARVVDFQGTIHNIKGLYEFCRSFCVSYKNFKKLISGELQEYKGWRICRLNFKEECNLQKS